MARLLARIGAFCARRKWWVLGAWVLILLISAGSAVKLSQPMTSDYDISGLQSVTTLDAVAKNFGGQNGGGGNIVFAAPKGQRLSAADKADVAALAASLAAAPGVTAAPDPFAAPQPAALSPDGRIGYISVSLSDASASDATKKAITSAVDAARSPQLQVEAASGLTDESGSSGSQLPGIIIALVVLLITFGTFVAAGLPLVTAIFGLGTGVTLVYAATSFVSLNSVAPTLAILLGLAVGIDYALFIVNRHRTQLLAGMEIGRSIALALGTAGSAVFFAAVTVIIALAGLAVVHIGFLTQMGLSAAFAVFVALLVSLSLTPALLALAGRRIVSKRAWRKAAEATAPQPHRLSHGWARAVTNHPIVFAIASLAVVVALALPVTGMRLGLPNDGTQPSSTTERRAYDLMADGFGPGVNGPIEVLASYGATPASSEVSSLVDGLSAVTDVARVIPSGQNGEKALLTIIPKSGPSDDSTVALVKKLRDPALGTAAAGSPQLAITGSTAVAIDVSDRLGQALPLYLGLIAAFAFLLLLLVFRSVLVPLKATVTFLLSLGASLGVTIAIFQWGWLGTLLHVDPAGPLLSFLPILVVGVLFGLSMDYEMFLVSGMREHHVHREEAVQAVRTGFTQGAKVVASAALIMIGVFGNGFVGGDSTIRPIAFALAVGVLIDAFVVRMTLVPALMKLFGRGAWWFPRWLDRITPQVDIEGSALER